MLEEFSFGFPILSYLIFLPLVGAAVLWLIDDEDLLKSTTLGITLVGWRSHTSSWCASSPIPQPCSLQNMRDGCRRSASAIT